MTTEKRAQTHVTQKLYDHAAAGTQTVELYTDCIYQEKRNQLNISMTSSSIDRISMLFLLLDLEMNDKCDDINFTHLT